VKLKPAVEPDLTVVTQIVSKGPKNFVVKQTHHRLSSHIQNFSHVRINTTPTRTMQDQILQTLFDKGNHSDHNGHDGFFDGPGNPIQSKTSPLCPFLEFPGFSDAGYSLTIVRNISNRYCCAVGISGVLDVLCITAEMVTFLHGLGSATRYPFLPWRYF